MRKVREYQFSAAGIVTKVMFLFIKHVGETFLALIRQFIRSDVTHTVSRMKFLS